VDDDAEVRQPNPGVEGAHPAYTTANGR
jgi:hypothetical protein